MVAGESHSIFIDKDGGIFAYGDANFGRLCITTNTQNTGYTENNGQKNKGGPITSTLAFKAAAAGSYHSVFATTNQVYTCGLNSHGQIGRGYSRSLYN